MKVTAQTFALAAKSFRLDGEAAAVIALQQAAFTAFSLLRCPLIFHFFTAIFAYCMSEISNFSCIEYFGSIRLLSFHFRFLDAVYRSYKLSKIQTFKIV